MDEAKLQPKAGCHLQHARDHSAKGTGHTKASCHLHRSFEELLRKFEAQAEAAQEAQPLKEPTAVLSWVE